MVSRDNFVTVMDLTKGYFQIPIAESSRRYATFVTSYGSYIPLKMCFGFVNAPFFFAKLMAQVLCGLEMFVLPYIDDTATYSETMDEHITHVDVVLDRLEEAKITVKPSKCKFAQQSVRFLGHEVGSGKRSPSEAKIHAIQDFPVPRTKTNIRSFLGICVYYSRYVKDYSVIAAPLTDALKGKNKKEKITWTTECQKAFEVLKKALTTKPILFAPDFKKEFILQTDASDKGVGVVLSQKWEGGDKPILYISRKFTESEKNYSTVERELAAIIYGVKKLHYYLEGQFFITESDHIIRLSICIKR